MAHILVVDDDRATVHLLTTLLEMDGFEVSQCPRPDTVLEQGKTKGADAFIIDCHLAGFNGLDLLCDIRADADLADKLVIVTSGKDLADEALAAGADLFLPKPFSPSGLSATLTELLGAKNSAE